MASGGSSIGWTAKFDWIRGWHSGVSTTPTATGSTGGTDDGSRADITFSLGEGTYVLVDLRAEPRGHGHVEWIQGRTANHGLRLISSELGPSGIPCPATALADSAVQAPQASFGGPEFDPALFDKAAARLSPGMESPHVQFAGVKVDWIRLGQLKPNTPTAPGLRFEIGRWRDSDRHCGRGGLPPSWRAPW
jgi:hypothetical protein